MSFHSQDLSPSGRVVSWGLVHKRRKNGAQDWQAHLCNIWSNAESALINCGKNVKTKGKAFTLWVDLVSYQPKNKVADTSGRNYFPMQVVWVLWDRVIWKGHRVEPLLPHIESRQKRKFWWSVLLGGNPGGYPGHSGGTMNPIFLDCFLCAQCKNGRKLSLYCLGIWQHLQQNILGPKYHLQFKLLPICKCVRNAGTSDKV